MGKRLFSKIFRYQEPVSDTVVGESVSLAPVERHIEVHIGKPSFVIHELASQYVHVDVHVVPPQPEHDFYTLVTSGMSDRPMKAPPQAQELQFAELMLCLPSSWRMQEYEIMSEETWQKGWPVIWLRQLARFPHAYKTWLFWGHSMPNGDPPVPFSPDTKFCGWVLLEPKLVTEGFKYLTRKEGGQIWFIAAVPVYKEEMELKLSEGAERLEQLFAEFGVTELVDPNRINVAVKN
jgi:hypothetical protein